MKLPLPLLLSAIICSNTKGKADCFNSVSVQNGFITSQLNNCLFACPLENVENPINISLASSELKLLLNNAEKIIKKLGGLLDNHFAKITKESDQYAKVEIIRMIDDEDKQGSIIDEAMIRIIQDTPINLSEIEIDNTHIDICLHYQWTDLIRMQSIAKNLVVMKILHYTKTV